MFPLVVGVLSPGVNDCSTVTVGTPGEENPFWLLGGASAEAVTVTADGWGEGVSLEPLEWITGGAEDAAGTEDTTGTDGDAIADDAAGTDAAGAEDAAVALEAGATLPPPPPLEPPIQLFSSELHVAPGGQ